MLWDVYMVCLLYRNDIKYAMPFCEWIFYTFAGDRFLINFLDKFKPLVYITCCMYKVCAIGIIKASVL